MLIYNGDADSCVPYVGNEEWVSGLAKLGYASEAKAWHPCMYASGSAGKNIVSLSTSLGLRHELQCHKRQPDAALAFVTIKLSGHEAPHYAPEPSFARFRASSPATRGERRTAVPTRASRRARLACRLHCAAAYAPDRMSSLLSAKS